jgi:hypothetical protein
MRIEDNVCRLAVPPNIGSENLVRLEESEKKVGRIMDVPSFSDRLDRLAVVSGVSCPLL